MALIGDVVVERAAVVANVGRAHCDVFDGVGLRFDCVRIGYSQGFAQTLRAVCSHSWSGGEVKRVDVVRAVLFDNRDDALAHAGKNRGDHDRGHYPDDNTEHGKKTAKLVPAHVVERHAQSFAREKFWKSKFHLNSPSPKRERDKTRDHVVFVSAIIGSSRAALNAG